MLALARWKVIVCIAAVLFGIWFTAPNLIPQKTLDSLPGWLPHQKLNLGLDLQGGSYLLLEVDLNSLKAEKLTNLVEDVRTTLRDKQIGFAGPDLVNGVVTVRITDPAQTDRATPLTTGQRDVVVHSQPGAITLALSETAMAVEGAKAVDQSIEII